MQKLKISFKNPVRLKKQKMKQKEKKEINIVLILALCLLIVGGASSGLNFLINNFEQNIAANAESLPTLPSEIKQNQISEIINFGYLN